MVGYAHTQPSFIALSFHYSRLADRHADGRINNGDDPSTQLEITRIDRLLFFVVQLRKLAYFTD